MNILLIDDSAADVKLVVEALKEVQSSQLPDNLHLHVVEDGEKALQYLKREGEYADVQLPDIILLDWNLPRVHGRDVLDFVKKNDRLNMIPVIVLTTSKSDADIHEGYFKGANCYITKPVDIENFFAIMKNLGQFWFNVVKLPSPQY